MFMSVIEINNVTKVFGNYNDKVKKLLDENQSKAEILHQTSSTVAVKAANFTVDESEIFVIMGLSGSGKSTLIRLINRLIDPSDGAINIKGKNVSQMSSDELRNFRRENLSMVFQNFALFPFKTILENTAFGLEVKDIPKKERLEKSKEALALVGLKGYENQYPNQLSGGMQQRVGLARALANDTDILLMDEAFSALDPLIRKDMQQELLQIQKSMKKTIVFITHDLDEALNIGDRIALMKDGEVVQIGTAYDIITNPANNYVRSFVKDINHAKVLRVKDIMKPVSADDREDISNSIAADKLLTESYTYFSGGDTKIPVSDGSSIIGTLHSTDVFNTLTKGNEEVETDA